VLFPRAWLWHAPRGTSEERRARRGALGVRNRVRCARNSHVVRPWTERRQRSQGGRQRFRARSLRQDSVSVGAESLHAQCIPSPPPPLAYACTARLRSPVALSSFSSGGSTEKNKTPHGVNTVQDCLQGYLGNTPARGSVGRCFLNLRKPRAKPISLHFLKLRKSTKAVGPRFLRVEKTHENGQLVFLEMMPVPVNVLY